MESIILRLAVVVAFVLFLAALAEFVFKLISGG